MLQGGRRVGDLVDDKWCPNIDVHQTLIAADVEARRRLMVEHQGIGRAGQRQNGADGLVCLV